MRSGQEELDRSRDRHINLPAPAPPFILRPPSNRINLNGARSTQTSATNEQRRRTRSGYAENERSRPEIRRHSMGGMAMGMTSRQSQSNSGQLNSRRSSASGVHDNNRLGRNTFDGRNQPQHPSSLRQSFSVNHRSGADRDNNMMDQDRDDDNVEHFSDGEEQEENRRRQAGHPVRTDMHDSRGSRFGTESMVSDIDEDDVGGDYYGEDYSNEGDEGEDWHVHTNGVNGAGRRSSVRSGWREDRGDQRDVDEDEDMGVEDGPHGDDRLRSNTQHVPPPHRRSNASIHTQQPSNNHFTTRAAASSHVTGAAHRRSSGGRVRRSSSSGSDGGEAPTSTRSNKRVRISESSIRRDSNSHSRQAGGDEDDWELDIEADIRDLQAVPGVEQQGLLGRMCEQYSRQLEQYTQILPEAKRAALRSYRKLLESAMVQTTKALAAFFLSLPRPDRPDPHNPLLFADSLSFIEDVPFARPIPLRHPLAITSGIAHRLNKLARIWAVAVERSGRNYLLAVDADHTCGYDVPVDQLEATLAMSKSLIIELKEMIRSLPALLEETFGVRVTFGFGDREGQQVGSARLAQERLSKALRTAIASWNAVGVNMRANVDNPRVFNKLHHVFIEDMTQMLSALYTMTYLPYQCTVWIDTSNQIVPLSGLYTANLGREQIGGGNRPS